MTELSPAAKEKRRAYKREWASRNKDKIQEYQRRYWEKRGNDQKEEEPHDQKR